MLIRSHKIYLNEINNASTFLVIMVYAMVVSIRWEVAEFLVGVAENRAAIAKCLSVVVPDKSVLYFRN